MRVDYEYVYYGLLSCHIKYIIYIIMDSSDL